MNGRSVLLMILIVVLGTAAEVLRTYAQAGVVTGDWIKFEYTVTGVSRISLPTWMRVEFLSVEGTEATVRVTVHMSDGTEQDVTTTVDIVAGTGTGVLSGLVIPANCTTGDSFQVSEYESLTIDGETMKSYAGARRTVVYASFSESGTDHLTYYWDKKTGIMVGSTMVLGEKMIIAKATETNMWQAQPSGLPIVTPLFYALTIGAIVIGATAVVFLIRRKRRPAEEIVAPTQTYAAIQLQQPCSHGLQKGMDVK